MNNKEVVDISHNLKLDEIRHYKDTEYWTTIDIWLYLTGGDSTIIAHKDVVDFCREHEWTFLNTKRLSIKRNGKIYNGYAVKPDNGIKRKTKITRTLTVSTTVRDYVLELFNDYDLYYDWCLEQHFEPLSETKFKEETRIIFH
jgi:hypothetical protein